MNTEPRKCPACNSDVSEQAKFCSGCGARLAGHRLREVIESYVDSKISEEFT
ncbi:zinc-ribbon domain-containing protein, partial [Acetobacter sp.]|uniref:zinc-ribbon domain-containing protein n=1 Tax=Acetobacter sp. TaxID=440 RepID=UPI0039E9C8B9